MCACAATGGAGGAHSGACATGGGGGCHSGAVHTGARCATGGATCRRHHPHHLLALGTTRVRVARGEAATNGRGDAATTKPTVVTPIDAGLREQARDAPGPAHAASKAAA